MILFCIVASVCKEKKSLTSEYSKCLIVSTFEKNWQNKYIFCNYSVNASVCGCLSLMLGVKVAFVIRFLTDVVFTSQFD